MITRVSHQTPLALRSKTAIAHAFKLQVGVADIPHPDKASRGGEDSYFVCDRALGVADGVGGWAESGVNPKDYSQGLMDVAKAYYCEENCCEEGAGDDNGERGSDNAGTVVVDDSGAMYDAAGPSARTTSGATPRASKSSMEALKRAHAETQKPGSSTACIVQIDLETGALDSSNLGDSGFLVVRDGTVVMRSEFQEHFFDCPFQLASLRFVPETDQATDAAVLSGQVEAGDLIVIGSDGLFDNVPVEDMMLAVRAVDQDASVGGSAGGSGSGSGSGSGRAQAIAEALGAMAFANSQDPEYESPYALEARKQGYELSFLEKIQAAKFTEGGLQLGQITGGKMDDVTVVVAEITEA